MNKRIVLSSVIAVVIVIALIIGAFAIFASIKPNKSVLQNNSTTDSSGSSGDSDTSSESGDVSSDISSDDLSSDQNSSSSTNGGNGNGSSSKPGGNGTITEDIKASARMANLAEAAVKTTGKSSVVTVSSTLWTNAEKYTCRTMTGKNSSISFAISGLSANKDLTLEVEEIHQRTDEVFAYTVTVNGKEVYFRTYDPSSDGTNHYFIPVDGSLIGSNGKANVTFTNYHSSTVRFARVWGYSNMDAALKAEGVGRKMSVAMLSPNLTYNLSSDKVTINRLVQQFGSSDMYEVSFALELSYVSQGITALRNKIDYLMQLSAETGTAFHLGMNSWWAGTPDGPDGLGGFFNDILYHQIVFDPLNIDGRGFWKLSTPNTWSNVPWLTMNNKTYNQARNYRLKDVTSYIQRKVAEYRVQGGKQPEIGIYMENEPVYWPYYAFNASPEAAGDFNASVIAAAKADGVTLNPEDGLSTAEKQWMYKNLRTYIAQEGEAVAEGYQFDAVVVNNGKVTLPTSQQIENAYTHMFPDKTFPINDCNYSAWETHAIPTLRFGGEWASDLNDERALDYIAALGKFSDVNAERSSMQDYSLLPQTYLYGADHVTIYNFKPSDASHYKSAGNKTDVLKTVENYDREIMSYNFMSADSLKAGNVLVEAVDVQRTALGENYVAGPTNKFAKGGSLTFKVDNKGTALSNGLVFEINGRILSDLAPAAKMTVYAGSSASDLQEVTQLKLLNPNKIDLSDYIDKSKSIAYVKVQMSATNASFTDWVSISSIKAYTKWDKESGSTSKIEYTYQQLRNRNLFMGYRADCERLLQTYLDRAGKDSVYQRACDLYNNQKYVSAYNLLTSNISETLPARYMVAGSGKLGKYNISLELGDKNNSVYVELTKAAVENYVFTLSSYDNITVKATFSGLTNGTYYKLNALENGKFELVKSSSASGAVKATGKQATFTISLGATSSIKKLPSSFEAKAYSDGSISAIKVQAQDYRVSDYANYTTLNIASNCKVWLGNDGDSDEKMTSVRATAIKAGDYLKIKVDSKNKVIEIKAYRGKITGTVTAVTQISVKGTTANATVTVKDSDNVLHTFEIGGDCKLSFSGRTGDLPKLTTIGNIGLKVGQTITVDYCPWKYNGRNQRAFAIS